MAWLSDNEMWEAFGSRALFHASYGGADFGECEQAVRRVGDGTADDWYREWSATAQKLVEAADAGAAAGHRVSAREAYLRASTYYRTAYYPLFGSPPDERLRTGFERESATLAEAVRLWDTPVETVEIPFEDGVSLPGLFARPSEGDDPLPTIVHVNGYDSNINEMFVAHTPAALSRGYALLIFDGPGQGRPLIRDGLPIRPDWETVVRSVIDFALGRSEVDAQRVVLAGWSFGGFLAPRAAAFERRIAALWADPGQWDLRDALVPTLPLSEDEKARFPDIDPARLDPMEEFLNSPEASPMLRWRLLQRGLWVHGKRSLFDYFAEVTRYEISSVASNITCPTLVTMAEADPIAAGAPKLLDSVGSERKALIGFSAAEGAAGHCEGPARRLFHQRCYDWLDETLAG